MKGVFVVVGTSHSVQESGQLKSSGNIDCVYRLFSLSVLGHVCISKYVVLVP